MPPSSDRSPNRSRRAGVWRALTCAALAASVAAGTAGCSVEHTLDGTRLENEISDQLLPDHPGVIRSVSCPDPPDPSPGQRVLCVATLEGEVVDVNVVLGGTEEDLTATATVDARFVAVNEVAALLAATFGDEVGLATRVDCGRPVVVLEVDEPVVCTATDPSGTARRFDVRIDDLGVVSLELR